MRTRRAVVLAAGVALLAPPSLAAADDAPDKRGIGSAGVGDEYFPYAGNGGYDVAHYDLSLHYDVDARELIASATITATATQRLRRFDLDLGSSLTVDTLTVNGTDATTGRDRRELKVTPAATLERGDAMSIVVDYHGRTHRPRDLSGSLFGWISTDDGAFVANECDGAKTWFPSNDHPRDEATYDLAITVPAGKTAISNGDLVGHTTSGGWTTWDWHAPDPMATYLVTAMIGDFDITTTTGPHGLPIVNAIDRDLPPRAARSIKRLPQMIKFFEGYFGPYPFSSAGNILDDNDKIGYALETQTRPIFPGIPGEPVVAHELSHQWFGNALRLEQWSDIWLNEGFAQYSQWMWASSQGARTPAEHFDHLYQRPASASLWNRPPGAPGPEHVFNGQVYLRGGMTLDALRRTVGDEDFFAILHAWATRPRDLTVSTLDFITLAENISGQQLGPLFEAWLYTTGKPPLPQESG